MSSSSAASPTSRKLLETIENAVLGEQIILAGYESRFEMVYLKKYNDVAELRSQHYNGYFVIPYLYLTFGRMALVSLCAK